MKKMILFTGLVAAYAASAQFLQNLSQALTQPEPAPAAQPVQVVQPAVQQVTTTTVVPAAPGVVAPPGYQTCPRCGGRGKEEHAMGFKVKRCKLCDGKGFLPPPTPELSSPPQLVSAPHLLVVRRQYPIRAPSLLPNGLLRSLCL